MKKYIALGLLVVLFMLFGTAIAYAVPFIPEETFAVKAEKPAEVSEHEAVIEESAAPAAEPQPAAAYLAPEYNSDGDAGSGVKAWTTLSVTEYEALSSCSKAVELDSGWYIAEGNIEVGGLVCTGDVKLLLADGCVLVANGSNQPGVKVKADASFAVYAQSEDEAAMGSLVATGSDYAAGIGGFISEKIGLITVNGGKVEAYGGMYGAGIGSCNARMAGVTVNGGRVTAIGGRFAAGIGSGYMCDAADLIINGGEISAFGGDMGAGIGSGDHGKVDNIIINNGSVSALGGSKAAGIGSGESGKASAIVINNGEINAQGGANGAGVGGGEKGKADSVAINGGVVTAQGGYGGAGIGSGRYADARGITISGGEITVNGGYAGAGIGCGEGGDLSGLKITGGKILAAGGGSQKTVGGGSVNAIGGGESGNRTDITVSSSLGIYMGKFADPARKICYTRADGDDLSESVLFKKANIFIDALVKK